MRKDPRFQLELKKPRAGASRTALARFENDTGQEIPSEYRAFLLCQNGGSPRKRNFTFGEGNYEDSVLRSFFGVNCPRAFDLEFILQQYAGRLPEGAFPVADDQFDNLVLVYPQPGAPNRIVFWDHEEELKKKPPKLIAPNLFQFLRMLEADELVEYEIATVTFSNGEKCRFVLPANLFSIDRNVAIDVRDARTGERINDFGVKRKIRKIEFSKEQGPPPDR